MSKPIPIQIIVGGQWGSEAKGTVAAELCLRRNMNYAVRTGAVNAGHTFYDSAQRRVVLQQLPVGAVNPNTTLVIGAGAMVHPEILAAEIEHLNTIWGGRIEDRIMIDHRAGLHLPEHTDQAKLENRHHAIGATGKGCSVAITDKIRYRGKGGKTFWQWLGLWQYLPPRSPRFDHLIFCDTEKLLNDAYDRGASIQVEGTQGALLDLHLGPYPYTTHKQTGAAQWMMECGLSPALQTEIVMVMRTFPIRVAGNSGPMPLEISWPALARRTNKGLEQWGKLPLVAETSIKAFECACAQVAYDQWHAKSWQIEQWSDVDREANKEMVSELHKLALEAMPIGDREEVSKFFEITTVTRKLRRIAMMDPDLTRAAIRQNRPHSAVITFMNYVYPELWGGDELHDESRDWVANWQEKFKVQVPLVSVGPLGRHLLATR